MAVASAARPMSREAGRRKELQSCGLSALQGTLSKLDGDSRRHEKTVENLARRMHLGVTQATHGRQHFSDSGYIFVKNIGHGRFGHVKLAKKKLNNYIRFDKVHKDVVSDMVAVRIIPRYRMGANHGLMQDECFCTAESHATLLSQIEALRDMDHPNICRELESFEDANAIYIVMELYTGGVILERETGRLPEGRVVPIIRQILMAMAYAHDRGIVHQDLRPENVHYASPDEDARLVVTDWSLSSFIDTPQSRSRRNVPVSEYSAPELQRARRTDRGDVWSIGAIAYALLRLEVPFLDKRADKDFEWTRDGEGFSDSCRDFIKSLLRFDPSSRPSAREALNHPWLNSGLSSPRAPRLLSTQLAKDITQFCGKSSMHKAVATFAASHLSGKKLKELTKIFHEMDTNHDGTLEVQEIEAALSRTVESQRRNGADTDAIADLLGDHFHLSVSCLALDTDGGGKIGYSEFLAAAAVSLLEDSVELCWEAFRAFDVDHNGRLQKADIKQVVATPEVCEILERANSSNELMKTLGELGGAPMSLKEVMERMDANGDDTIDFPEFMQALFGKTIANMSDSYRPVATGQIHNHCAKNLGNRPANYFSRESR